MKKEDIEKAAKEALLNGSTEFRNTKIGTFQQGFVVGAEWRINSVWHDNKVMPDRNLGKEVLGCGEDVIVKPKYRPFIEICNACWDEEGQNFYFDGERETFLMEDVEFWAYVKDLLPERKEKTNGSC